MTVSSRRSLRHEVRCWTVNRRHRLPIKTSLRYSCSLQMSETLCSLPAATTACSRPSRRPKTTVSGLQTGQFLPKSASKTTKSAPNRSKNATHRIDHDHQTRLIIGSVRLILKYGSKPNCCFASSPHLPRTSSARDVGTRTAS